MAFNVILNPTNSPINESESLTLSGEISDLAVQGGEVTLDINWGDPLSPPQNQQILLKDDGNNGDQVAGDGKIQFSSQKNYLDDNPTGTPSDAYTINVDATENFLIGTDAVFVIDRSGSTGAQAQGLTAPVGDQNGDGSSNTILDVEISSFKALNQSLIDRGLGNTAKVSSVQFSSAAQGLDMEPGTAGFQSFTTPLTDSDNNGILDVNQVLSSLTASGATNYEAALQQAISAVTAAGTASGQGNVIFLSDGFPNAGGAFNDEANTIRNTQGQNLRAFGVGTGATLPPLQTIDPNAQVFTDSQDLLDVFGGAGSGASQDSASTSVTVNDVAPELSSVSDNLPASGIIVEGDTLELSANYTDAGTLDSHTVDFNWGDGSPVDSTLKAPLLGGTGNANGSHVYSSAGAYTANLTVTDDDTLSDSESVNVNVANKVDIDWKPGSNPSAMNFTGGGTIPVSILGGADFDVKDIDVASVRFDDEKDALLNGDGVGINVKNNGNFHFSYEDTNKDGQIDLVAHVKATELGSVVDPDQDPFATDGQIYAFGAYDAGNFFGIQQFDDPIVIVG